MIKRYFAGGNTCAGFFSYYGNITGPNDRLIILKGGPGVGKSSFMKRIGAHFSAKGFNVEYFFCSSDCSSLDGVRIPKLCFSIVDGTAPHVVDPKLPAAADEILNFGEFIDVRALSGHREEVAALTYEISGLFGRAYRYLAAAGHICEDSAAAYACDFAAAEKRCENLSQQIFGGYERSKQGSVRRLFMSAITPDGVKNFLKQNTAGAVTYVLNSELGGAEGVVMDLLLREAVKRGSDCECFCCALNPQKIEHAYFIQQNCYVVTSNEYHTLQSEKTYDLKEICLPGGETLADRLFENRNVFNSLLGAAIKNIRSAKAKHDELEKFYIPHVAFSRVDALFDTVVHRMENSF